MFRGRCNDVPSGCQTTGRCRGSTDAHRAGQQRKRRGFPSVAFPTTSVLQTMNRVRFFAFVVASLLFATLARADTTISANDTALFLAGMPLPANSPLVPLAEDPSIKPHAVFFDSAFDKVEKNQLS